MKRKILIIILALLTINMVIANPTIDWINPSQNTEIIDGYPQSIRYIARDAANIDNCTTTIGQLVYITTIGTTTADITTNTKLPEGEYNITINCTGTGSTQETKTIIINDMINLAKQKKENTQIYIYIIIMTILTLILISQKKAIYRLLIGVIATISSIIIYTQIQENLLVIPITLTSIITLYYLMKTIFKG